MAIPSPLSAMATSVPTAGPTPLGQLLSESFAYYKAHFVTLAIGAVVFGILMGLLGVYSAGKVQSSVSEMMGGMGVDLEKMEELSARMEAGDETALAELEAAIGGIAAPQNPEEAGMKAMSSMAKMMPFVGVAGLISFLLSFVAHAFYVLVAVEGKDVNGTMSRAQGALLPLVGVSLWSFLRSFAWIPLLGIIPAIILGPRFVAAPLIYLTEGKGVTASVSSSYARTRGYWPKIVGNVIVAALVMIIAGIVLGIVFGMALGTMSPVAIVVKQVVSQVLMAFMAVFIVRLSHTILQHPRA